MALESQKRVVAIHAVAIVRDADQLASAGFNLDANAMCSGIERVLQQLFDDGRGRSTTSPAAI